MCLCCAPQDNPHISEKLLDTSMSVRTLDIELERKDSQLFWAWINLLFVMFVWLAKVACLLAVVDLLLCILDA